MICVLGCGEANVEYDCKKDVYYNLTEDESNKIPYKERDTLIFLSDIGDTAIVYGILTKGYNYRKEGGGGNCPVWGIYAERRIFEFRSKVFELDSISTGWGINMYNKERTYFINNLGYPINKVNDISLYTDTVTYKGYKIQSIILDKSDSKIKSVLYNYNYGILRIVTTNNRTWTLIN